MGHEELIAGEAIKTRPNRLRALAGQTAAGGVRRLKSEIVLDPQFEPLSLGIEQFSHLVPVYWLSEITAY